ncbi:MAG: DUF4900 domain-containing protein [Bradymonadales bacterium]|nr:MAG: DUF4900 domain-containing protein [Bradymonadales bacterium]
MRYDTLRPMHKTSQRGFALGIVIMTIVLSLSLALVYLNRSHLQLSISGIHSDSVIANFQMEAAYEEARNFLEIAVEDIRMDGAFQLHPSTPSTDSISNLNAVYGGSPAAALNFLRHAVESQSIDTSGVMDPTHPHFDFDTAFSSDWTPFNTQDAIMERRYSFEARAPIVETFGGNPSIFFQYDYTLEVRAYGTSHFSQAASQEKGVISILLSRAPFSRFALFRSQNRNQDGNILVFAGGDTSAQIQEVFSGPVHLNQSPIFYGAPVFLDVFTSGAAQSSWQQMSVSGYSGTAVFHNQALGDQETMELPTEVNNVIRLAVGDSSPNAAFDNTPLSSGELVNFLRETPGYTLPGSAISIPPGVHIPVSDQTNLVPKGGVYIEGDSNVRLNVVQGESDFAPERWAQISSSDQACKFQKMLIEHHDDVSLSREIYIADEPCNSTYVFTPDPTALPHVLAGRINGNVHANGKIDQLGGESRTRPAIATDFGFTVSAKKEVRIVNDIQYEDSFYHSMDSDGNVSYAPVATPWGDIDGSGIHPTDQNVLPKINSESKTVLGILSTHKNVLLHIDAPANLNLHAAIFAGNPNHYDSSTDLGCGANHANQRGCGFGNEGWNTNTGMGSFKFLGSISEYRSQSMGRTSNPPTGYQRRLAYDQRFLEDLVPPAYPLSESLQAFSRVERFRAWRLVQAED